MVIQQPAVKSIPSANEARGKELGRGAENTLLSFTSNFHIRTVHLDIIKVFYSPTDAQVNCLKNNINIYINP